MNRTTRLRTGKKTDLAPSEFAPHLPTLYRPALELLAQRTGRPVEAEVEIAIQAHLYLHGLWATPRAGR